MEEFKYPFENLNAWQESRKYVVEVYRLLEQFPQSERFALIDQIRRAVISVPSNIAEGSGRMSYKEKIHFLEIAYGSLMEVYCQFRLYHSRTVRRFASSFFQRVKVIEWLEKII